MVGEHSCGLAERGSDGSRGLQPTVTPRKSLCRGATLETHTRATGFNRRSATSTWFDQCRGLKPTATFSESLRDCSKTELRAAPAAARISPVNLPACSLSSFDNNQVLIAMVDEAKLRRRVLLRLFGSPLVVSPFVLGMTALTAVWAAGWTLGIGVFAAVAGLLTAGGAGLTRLLLNGEKTAQTVRAELEQEEVQQREARLDELDRRMVSADDDPRPEAALRDLRALLHAFEELAARSEDVALYALVEVRAKVEQLFDQSVEAFEQTLKLGAMAE
jgi:hypothetical protein